MTQDLYQEHCYAYHIFHEIAKRSGPDHPHSDDPLSKEFGFLVTTPPVTALPASHAAWDEVAGSLPRMVGAGSQRAELERMPHLSAEPDALADEYLCRAITIISHLAHAYYMGDILNGEERAKTLPDHLEEAWQTLCQRLNRPRVGMTGFESVLYNWRFKDDALDDTRKLENFDLLVPFFGNAEERIFNLSFLETSVAGAPLPYLCIEAQDAVLNNDQDRLISLLKDLISQTDLLTKHLLKLDPMPGSPNYLHPVVWAKTAPSVSSPYRPSEAGLSGGSVPPIHLLDIFLGRTQYRTEMGRQEQERRHWLGRGHIDFLNALYAVSVRNFVAQSKNPILTELFNQLYESYSGETGFLGIHRRKIYIYMELGFKAGRGATNAGLQRDSDEEPWVIVDHELEEGRVERHQDKLDSIRYGRIESIYKISEQVSGVDLSVTGGAVYRAGDRCSVHVENSEELIVKTLKALDAKDDSLLRISQKWQEFFKKNHPELSGELILLRDFLRFAKIRPLTRDVAAMFYRLTGLKVIRDILDQHLEDQFEFWDFLELIALRYNPRKLWSVAPWQQENLSRMLQPESPRLYSIVSSAQQKDKYYSTRISLAVGDFSYDSNYRNRKNTRHGTGSAFLASPAHIGREVVVKLHRPWFFDFTRGAEHPLFLFTSGTGITAFIGLLKELQQSQNTRPVHIFYGCQDSANLPFKDFLFKLAETGIINLYLAFSRIQEADLPPEDRELLKTANVEAVFGVYVDQFLQDPQLAQTLRQHASLPITDAQAGYFYVAGSTSFYTTIVDAIEKLLADLDPPGNLSLVDQLVAEKRLESDLFVAHLPKQRNVDGSITYIPVSDVLDYNNPEKGYWMVIDDVVYDISKYVNRHPGGDIILKANCGLDATQAYKNVDHHKWPEIQSLLKSYQIGLVERIELNTDIEPCLLNGKFLNISQKTLYGDWVKTAYKLVEMENTLQHGYELHYEESKANCQIIYDTHTLVPKEFLPALMKNFLEPLCQMVASLYDQEREIAQIHESLAHASASLPKPPVSLKQISQSDDDYLSLTQQVIHTDQAFFKQVKSLLQDGLRLFESGESCADLAQISRTLVQSCQDYSKSLQNLYKG